MDLAAQVNISCEFVNHLIDVCGSGRDFFVVVVIVFVFLFFLYIVIIGITVIVLVFFFLPLTF